MLAGNVLSASASASRGVDRVWHLVRLWWRGEAIAQSPGVRVSIDGTPASGLTDVNGLFRIEGGFFGPANVRFTGNGADGVLPLTFPAGGLLQLDNVEIAGGTVTVQTRQIEFSGPLDAIDCQAGVLRVLSGALVAFRVFLQSGTAIVDERGQAIECDNLVTSRRAEVIGTVEPDGDVLAGLIESVPGVAVPTPTNTPIPTETPEPTATPTPTRTPTP